MFMMLTLLDGSVVDVEVKTFGWTQQYGTFHYLPVGGSVQYLIGDKIARIEWYPSREAALVDGADLRDYPALK